MRIREIRLIAFGPFTDGVLRFESGNTDFHIVYGRNEAGKSSALRALRQMLFGIPLRTPDSFQHPNPSLRIGAVLENRDHTRIEFIRRKGKSKTLRGPDDRTVLNDDALNPFLGGVSQGLFEQMFAIGHADLVEGGKEIVSGEGRLGQALFAAGAGLIQLQKVQQGLEQDCDALFKPGGSKPRINVCISELQAARRNQKEAQLPAKTWRQHYQAREEAQQRLAAVKETLERLKMESSRLERIQKALPFIARRKELDESLRTLSDAPELPDDFSEKRRGIENERQIAVSDLKRSEAALRRIDEQAASLTVPADLLRHAADVEALQQDLGSFRKAQKDRPGLEARMRTLNRQAADKMAELSSPKSAAFDQDVRLPPSVAGEIQDLTKSYERLTSRLAAAREQRSKISTRIRTLTDRRSSLAQPINIRNLKIALAAAVDAGPVEKQAADARRSLAHRQNQLNHALSRQTLWSGSLPELEALPLPSREAVDRFEEDLTASLRRIEKLQDEMSHADAELEAATAELCAMQAFLNVPTESDLAAARRRRTEGWTLVRGKLSGESPEAEVVAGFIDGFDGAKSLVDAFEKSLAETDHIADRLRREAAQVNRKSVLEADQRRCRKKTRDLREALEAAKKRHTDEKEQWRRLWAPSGIDPRSPKEMRTWLADMGSLRDKYAEIRHDALQADAIDEEAAQRRRQLAQELAAAGETTDPNAALSQLIRIAQNILEFQENLQAAIESVQRELAERRHEGEEAAAAVAELEKELARWKNDWGQTVSALGLETGVSTTAAAVVVENMREARALLDEADVLRKRIEGIDRDAAAFHTRVQRLTTAVAPELQTAPIDSAARQLNVQLMTAMESLARQKNLSDQRAETEQERQRAEKRIADADARLAILCREAGCRHPEALAEAEKRAARRRLANKELTETDRHLRELGAGETRDAFIAEALNIDADRIGPEQERLAEEIEVLEQERSALDQTIGTEKAELRRMDGNARAAEHAESAERLLACLESDVAQYSRLRLASLLLAHTIEQYRKKHQGPLIQRASELFSQMTDGSFEGVRAEYDENGNPVMVGVRPQEGLLVEVAGMSDGTADQLYLALRLASLEHYLEHSEPLPFVVDDILLRFDDRRAAATLAVLAELSSKTQVIFFTHHIHMLDLAEQHLPAGMPITHKMTNRLEHG